MSDSKDSRDTFQDDEAVRRVAASSADVIA